MRKVLSIIVALILACLPVFAKQSKLHERAEAAALVLYGESASKGIDALSLCTAEVYEKIEGDGYLLLTRMGTQGFRT